MNTYTQEFREKTVADCLASGMSQPKFAERIGISLSTLKSWIYSRPDCRPAEFVDLTAAAGPDPAGGKPAGGKTVEITINGATVAGDPAAIAEIIRGLGR